jgi:hypothetical protein
VSGPFRRAGDEAHEKWERERMSSALEGGCALWMRIDAYARRVVIDSQRAAHTARVRWRSEHLTQC